MGNHCPPGIPPLLAKNWHPVPDHPNTFQNKLTSEYTHKHIINVQDQLEIQSFKLRMKQTNLYVCRVLFYHQYHESIYHVYTDQIHLLPAINKYQLWRFHKIKIVETFAQLAAFYGLTKVCRQMIGADSNGQPKVWIHPDPVCSKLWLPCQTEQIMLTDIINIFNNLQEKFNINSKKKSLKSTITPASLRQYLSFEDYIRSQTLIMNEQIAELKAKQGRNSSLTQNHSLQGQKHFLDLQIKKSNQNKTFGHQYNQNKTKIVPNKHHKTSDIQQHINQHKKNSKLSKLFNTVMCETSRDQPKQLKLVQFPAFSPIKHDKISKNLSLQKHLTYNIQSPNLNLKKNHDLSHKVNFGESVTIGKRRQTQKFKSIGNMDSQKGTHPITKSKLNLKQKRAYQEFKPHYNSNPLNQIFIQPQKPHRAGSSPQNIKRSTQNKSYQNLFCNPQATHNKPNKSYNEENITQKNMGQGSKKHMKFTNFPYFLMKSNAQYVDREVKKQPSTERQSRQYFFYKTKRLQQNAQKNGIYIISSKSLEQDQESQSRPIQHSVSQLKDQLHFILDTPIEPQPRPVSLQYQSFKSSQMLYRPNNMYPQFEESQSQKGQLDLIKYKVQEKKTRFAQLKLDAKKILQDDF